MRCPVCAESQLVMTERQGIEIDYCPQCRGVWLDRGELDKIIERAAPIPMPSGATPQPSMPQPSAPQPSTPPQAWNQLPPSRDDYDSRRRHDDDDDDDDRRYGYKKKKRGGLLGDLFDFD
jgi:Zn-finger nucleic acid-binding protein